MTSYNWLNSNSESGIDQTQKEVERGLSVDSLIASFRPNLYEDSNTFFVGTDNGQVQVFYDQSKAVNFAIEKMRALATPESSDALDEALATGKLVTYDRAVIVRSQDPWEFTLFLSAYFCPSLHLNAVVQDQRHLKH